jgi:hypothetical protein
MFDLPPSISYFFDLFIDLTGATKPPVIMAIIRMYCTQYNVCNNNNYYDMFQDPGAGTGGEIGGDGGGGDGPANDEEDGVMRTSRR